MSVATLRPNGTIRNDGTLTGGASLHAVLSDDSDGSFVTSDGGGDDLEVNLGDYSEVAGSVVKKTAIRIRVDNESPGGGELQVTAAIDGDPEALVGNVFVPGFSPATITAAGPISGTFSDSALDGATVLIQTQFAPVDINVYELFFDVTYVEQPDLTVDAPSGTVTDTNQPTVEWTPDLDSDGGSQTRFEVKVFDDATYGGGGFDPDTSTPTAESGEVTGSATSWQVDEPLADDTYRAYVRIAQTVNGELHWSDWTFGGFTIDVDAPADPTLTLTPQDSFGRIQIDLDDNAGAATTDAFEVQFSHDGGSTWTHVRTDEGEGIVTGDDETLWDYEAPNGETVTYRARALHDYSGLWAASAWVQDSDAWSSSDRWLKHPTDPNLNTTVEVHSYPSHQRAARQAVHQPLGRTDPVVISDTRGPKRGEITFWLDNETERDTLDALLDSLDPLLLQMADGDERPDRWVVFGNSGRESAVDKLAVSDTMDTYGWTEVARP